MTKRRLGFLAPLAALFAETVACAATSAGDETATLRFLEIPHSRIVIDCD